MKQTLREEVQKYASGGRGANILLFAILDDDQSIYAVNAVDYPNRQDVAGVVILARLVGNIIVIEEDMTDKLDFVSLNYSVCRCFSLSSKSLVPFLMS